MDHQKVLEKIKKCLALAQSGNEHEAAVALRQAQALMRVHGVSEQDVLTADVSTCDMRSRAKRAPAQWEMMLMNRIAHAFDCELAFHHGFDEGRWVFIGVGAAAEVAQYTADVMLRQALKARDAYSAKKLGRVMVRANKVRRADLFCTGWVSVATSLVIGGGHTTHPALLAYMDAKYGKESITGNDRNGSRKLREYEYGDYTAGQAAGHGAQLNRGLGSAGKPLMLG